jgi:NNP family nitrate/nitrite transporter-like MFS transporter
MHRVTGMEATFAFSVYGKPTCIDGSNDNLFKLPLDSEHKATCFKLFYLENPHMGMFHLSWQSFCTCFVSTFVVALLLPTI